MLRLVAEKLVLEVPTGVGTVSVNEFEGWICT